VSAPIPEVFAPLLDRVDQLLPFSEVHADALDLTLLRETLVDDTGGRAYLLVLLGETLVDDLSGPVDSAVAVLWQSGQDRAARRTGTLKPRNRAFLVVAEKS
jgi:hypothetical protein